MIHQRELTVITEDNSYHVDLTKSIYLLVVLMIMS